MIDVLSAAGYPIVRARTLKNTRVRFIRRRLAGVPLDRDARRCYAPSSSIRSTHSHGECDKSPRVLTWT